jgi:hypothetical protein
MYKLTAYPTHPHQDPYLVEVQDECEDPTKIRDEVHRYVSGVVFEIFVMIALPNSNFFCVPD